MKKTFLTPCLLAAGIALASGAQAADVRINGFASVVAGMTTSEGTARNQSTGAESDATFGVSPQDKGSYDDDLSFKPDSIFGIQISSDLGNGLSVTGQITGSGDEDFEAEITWAYLTYEFNDNWSMIAGRQRVPLFFYSDYLDVAYAYHWVRIPVEMPASFIDTYEGVKFAWTHSTDNWDWSAEVYAGAGSSTVVGFDFDLEDVYGGVIKVSNDWLQLRANYMTMDAAFPSDAPLFRNGVRQATDDDPFTYSFAGIAAHMTLGDGFIMSEYGVSSVDEPFAPDFDVNGFDGDTGWYISGGWRFGNLTPHITYATNDTTRSKELTSFTSDQDDVSESWTIGVRWDFHPSAAFKLEYTTRDDESDDEIKNDLGGFGLGDAAEVDLISAGFDIIF